MLNRRRLSPEQEVVQGPDDYHALLLIKAVRSEELSETVERGVEEGRGHMIQSEQVTIYCYGGCSRSVTLRKSKASNYLCYSRQDGAQCEANSPSLAL